MAEMVVDGSRGDNDVHGDVVSGAEAVAVAKLGRDKARRAIAVAGELTASPAALTAVVAEAGDGAEGTHLEEHTNAAANGGGCGDNRDGTASRVEQRRVITKRSRRKRGCGRFTDAADAALSGFRH